MSDLYRSALAARIAQLPPMPPPISIDDEEDDELGSLPSLASTSKQKHHSLKTTSHPDEAFAPISASAFFSQAVEVEVPDTGLIFRVYYTSPKHADGTVMVCHHGAGYSALSFALLAGEIVERTGDECGVLAIDARRHGNTRPISPSTSDNNLGIEVLTKDFVDIIFKLFGEVSPRPTLLLVGHSMGGAVVTRACPSLLEMKFRIAGVVVLDVVEGSALEALPHMHSLLNSRPDGFDSPEEAIEWHLSNHTIRNSESARVSVPSLIVPSSSSKHAYEWRTPLKSTAPYWTSWFTGLSSAFLSARTARLLILAGTDRLDKELMIGQMQGKFQMNVIPNVGHMLHEDDPVQIAEILIQFWKRNERVLVGVKKVGEL